MRVLGRVRQTTARASAGSPQPSDEAERPLKRSIPAMPIAGIHEKCPSVYDGFRFTSTLVALFASAIRRQTVCREQSK